MTKAEIIAILSFLERTRQSATGGLGVDVPDPYWRMVLVLMRSRYTNRDITVSALANASDVPYTTALRHIRALEDADLLKRRRDRHNRKLIYVAPTDTLVRNFLNYCAAIKAEFADIFGLNEGGVGHFVFGGSHLVAKIIPRPSAIGRPVRNLPRLRMLLKDESTFVSLSRLKSEIASYLGIDFTIEILGYDDLYAAIIENSRRSVSDFDIIAVDMPWIGNLFELNAIRQLDDLVEGKSLNIFDFYAAAWEGGQYRGIQMGIPFAPTAELLFYRQDLFDEAGLQPPKTTAEVLEAARKLHRPEAGRYGISWNAARGQPFGQTFIQVLGAYGSAPVNLESYGDEFDLDFSKIALRPTFNTDAGLATLAYLNELSAYSPPDIADMDWSGRISAYRSGRTAMTYEWSARAAAFESDIVSPARGRTGYLPHPAGPHGRNVCPMGGFVLCIPSNVHEETVPSIWQAVRWMCSPEVVKHLVINGSSVSLRYSVSADPEVRQSNPVLPAVDSMARIGQIQLWQRPPIPQMTDMMQVIGEELHEAIWGERQQSAALQRAEDRVKSLFEAT